MTRRFSGWLTENRQRLGTLIRDHTTLSITLFYLLLTVVGATYEFFVLMRFRVNVLQFADPQDFLLAAIRQPLVIVFGLAPLVLLWLIEMLDQGTRRMFPRYAGYLAREEQKPSYRVLQSFLYPSFIAIYFMLFTIYFSGFVADRLRRGLGRPVAVRLSQPSDATNPWLRGTLLGTTAKYVFVYQAADTSTHVLPIESIVEMQVLRRPRPNRPPRISD